VTACHRAHDTGRVAVLRDWQAALGQVRPREPAAEAKPLTEQRPRSHDGRCRGPHVRGESVPLVWDRLGVGGVQAEAAGASTSAAPAARAANAVRRHGANPQKRLARIRLSSAGYGSVGSRR
jgi:hypothetical protein